MGACRLAMLLERLPVTSIRKSHDGTLQILREAAQTLRLQEQTIRRLKYATAPIKGAKPKTVQADPAKAAQSVCARLAGRADIYVTKAGAVVRRAWGSDHPRGAEYVGTFDENADWRDLAEAIEHTQSMLDGR